MKRSLKFSLAQRIKKLARGGSFQVATEYERNVALDVASTLRATGALAEGIKITTSQSDKGGWNVVAIPE